MKKLISSVLAVMIFMTVSVSAEYDYLFKTDYNYEELDGSVTVSQLGSVLKAYGTNDGTYDPVEFFVNTDIDDEKYFDMKGSGYIQQATGYSPKITEDVGVFEMLCKVSDTVPSFQIKLNYTTTFADGYQFPINIPENKRGTDKDWFRIKVIFTSEGNYMTMIDDDVISPMSNTNADTIKNLFNVNLAFYRIINRYSNGAKGRELLIKNIYTYQIPQGNIVSSLPQNGDDWAEVDGNIELGISGDIDINTLGNMILTDADHNVINIETVDFDNGIAYIKAETLIENTEYTLDVSGISDIYGVGLKTKSVSFTTKLTDPKPYEIKITGSTRIQIKDGAEEKYEAQVLNVRGTTKETDQTVIWTLGGEYEGVTIEDGILKVSKDAKAGEIEIAASAGDIVKRLSVYLDDVDVTELIDVTERAEKVIEEITTEEFDTDKFDDLVTKTENGSKLINKEQRTQEEVDNACEEIKNSAVDLIISAYGTPIAENVKMSGEAIEGVGYSCSADIVANEKVNVIESDHEWFVGEGTNYLKKENNLSHYGFDKDDYEKSVYANVIPKYEYMGFEVKGEAVKTEIKNAPSMPVVTDVKITGTAKVGETLGVSYTFYHREGFVDNGSKIKWIDASSGKVISEGKNYKLTSSDKGMSLIAEVTPVTDKAPKEGKPVESGAVRVSEGVSSGSSGGSGGGSSGNGSKKGGYTVSPTVVNTDKESFKEETKTEKQCKFNDISGHWAEKNIIKMFDAGYVNGVSETEYMPDKKITRAEFISMIVRIMGLKANGNGYFSDVSNDSWYSEPLSAAYENGIISGADGKANPNNTVTREEMAKIVVNVYELLKNEKLSEKDISVSDIDEISEWAKTYVNKAFNAGLLNGTDNERFAPKEGATRAQAVVVTERLLNAVRG